MANENEDGRFQVKVPDPSKRYNKAGTQWVRSTLFDLKGRTGSRTGKVRFRNVWYAVTEHESIDGSFLAGRTCAAPKDAPAERKLVKRARKGAKKAAPKKGSSKRGRKGAKAASSKSGTAKRAAGGAK